jgi:hypothetical protein
MLALAALMLAAAAAPKLVVPPVSGAGVEDAKLRVFTSQLAQDLRSAGLEVITSDEIALLLGAERQKQLLGCSDESCLAELSEALGTSATVKGSIAKVGDVFQLGVTVLGNDTRILAEHGVRVSSEAGLLDALDEAARAVARKLGVTPPRRLRPIAWVPAVLGLAASAAGGYLLAQSRASYDQLNAGRFAFGQGELVATQGGQQQAGGWLALGLGLAAIAAGVLLFLVAQQ